MVETPDLIRHESAGVHEHDLQRRMPVEQAGQDEATGGDARLQRITREIRHVEIGELRTNPHVVRMKDHGDVELGGDGEERLESAIVQRNGLHGGTDLDAAQAQPQYSAPQLGGGSLGIL